ncbi:protein FAM210B, mitochondrial [Hyperolius riggenbachi]|uniref:protein FAM210B, mitochondrial n=1 Tax=Hyperolius riggenbachi TaxID=752182 RepID=UPI0035A2C634
MALLLLPGCRGWALRGARGLVCAGRLYSAGEAGAVRPSLLLLPPPRVTARPIRALSQGPSEPLVKETGGTADSGENKPSKRQQLTRVFKEYGGVAVAFHVGISLVSLGIFYVLVSNGLDVPALLLKLGVSESVVQSKLAAGTSTFVLAYAIHKVFAPLRMTITVVSVPLLVRYFRKIGFFKPPPPRN